MPTAEYGLWNNDRRKSLLLGIVMVTVCCLPVIVYAETAPQPKITIEPAKIGPGDIAVITVSNSSGPVEGIFNNRKLYFNASTAAQNSFKAILGIDLYFAPGEYALDIVAADTPIRRTVTVSKKKYPLQRLTLPKDMVILSPENEARVAREQKKTAAVWPVDSPLLWTGSFINPLPGKKVGTKFGMRRVINNVPKSSHSGVDITADEGEPVLAPNDGVAVLTDDQFYSGKCVILDHGHGIYTMFFHLSKINVRYGQAVMKGESIGLVGSTGRSTGAHLHWGVRIQGARVDPLELIHLKLE
jgi:murein DD-endopeptidase MepM/ murein hydrolase activator NlpD